MFGGLSTSVHINPDSPKHQPGQEVQHQWLMKGWHLADNPTEKNSCYVK